MAAQPDVIEKKIEKTGAPVLFDYPEGRSAEDYNPTGFHKVTGRDFSELICNPMQKQIDVEFKPEGIEVTNLSERSFKEGSVINITLDRRGSSIGEAKIVGITNTARTMDTPAFLTNVANPDGPVTSGHITEKIPEHQVNPESNPGVDPVSHANPLEHTSIPLEEREGQLDDAIALEEARAKAAKEASDTRSDVANAVAEAETEAKTEAEPHVQERADAARERAAEAEGGTVTTADLDAATNTKPAPTEPQSLANVASAEGKDAKDKAKAAEEKEAADKKAATAAKRKATAGAKKADTKEGQTQPEAKAEQDKDKNAAEKAHDASKPDKP